MTKELFELCEINLDFTYITDARKVYPIESIKYKNDGCETNEIMDYKRKMRRKLLCNKTNNYINKELLLKEINYCKPDLILILGNTGLELLDSKENLTTLLEGNCCITIEGTAIALHLFHLVLMEYIKNIKINLLIILKTKFLYKITNYIIRK